MLGSAMVSSSLWDLALGSLRLADRFSRIESAGAIRFARWSSLRGHHRLPA